MPTELIHSLDERAARLAELNHAWLQVIERAFDQTVLLLVVGQEVMPQRMLLGRS